MQTKLFDTPSMNHEIDKIILTNNLTREGNNFFNGVKTLQVIPPEIAFEVAVNWVEITKTFLFTVIQGLGALAFALSQDKNQNIDKHIVLQTAFFIISDDLNNQHPVFKKVAPKGPEGIHYMWWENTVVKKLRAIVDKPILLTDGTKKLITKMNEFANDIMGAAVQLRVVEAIAYDIASAFLVMVNKANHHGIPVFTSEADKIWITAHIEAEIIHNEKVCNALSGMARIAQTPSEQNHMLQMTHDYCQAWADALTGFATLLQIA